MEKNVGKTDKLVRMVLGIIFAILAVFFVAGILRIIFYILAFVMFFTAFTEFCLLYKLTGINTNKNSKE